MFFLSLAEHNLQLPPQLLTLPLHEAIKKVLDDVFFDKVISDLGLCVSIYDIKDVNNGFIQSGEGASTCTALFRMVVFRPFLGEVIIAKLKESVVDGLRLSIGFFDDIFVLFHQLPKPRHQIPDLDRRYKVRWIWGYILIISSKQDTSKSFHFLSILWGTLQLTFSTTCSFRPRFALLPSPSFSSLLLFFLAGGVTFFGF